MSHIQLLYERKSITSVMLLWDNDPRIRVAVISWPNVVRTLDVLFQRVYVRASKDCLI